ncbi:MAG: hypothetical protein ACSHXK_16050 [Oceanococcus sp.]
MSLLASSLANDASSFGRFMQAKAWTVFAPDSNKVDDHLFSTSLASITDHLQRMEARRSRYTNSNFVINLGFLESVLPNALANKDAQVHIAAMHTGLAMVILEFSWFCLAQKQVFPELGDIAQETSPRATNAVPPGLSVLVDTISNNGLGDAAPTPPIMPVDPHRAAAAHYLTLLMMRFVWLHEIAHGVLGHVDYLRSFKADSGTSLGGLDELNYNELAGLNPSIDGRVLQCLEFEADSWALSKSIIIQKDGLENIDGIAALPMELRIRMNLFGIYAMSWLMETMASTLNRGRLNITHPAPIRRMQMLQNMAVWELNDLGLDAPTITRSVLVEFESVLSQIGEQWLQMDKFEPVSYRAVFEETRDTLKPFRYIAVDD